MLEPVLRPIFSCLGFSGTSEEINKSVRKIEQFVLPILAMIATYYASISRAPTLVIHLTSVSGATVALGVFIRNWRVSASSEPEVKPELSKVEEKGDQENVSDVENKKDSKEENVRSDSDRIGESLRPLKIEGKNELEEREVESSADEVSDGEAVKENDKGRLSDTEELSGSDNEEIESLRNLVEKKEPASSSPRGDAEHEVVRPSSETVEENDKGRLSDTEELSGSDNEEIESLCNLEEKKEAASSSPSGDAQHEIVRSSGEIVEENDEGQLSNTEELSGSKHKESDLLRNVEREKEEEESSSSTGNARVEIEGLSQEDLQVRDMLGPNVTWQCLERELNELAVVSTKDMSLEEQKKAHELSKTRFQTLLRSSPEFQTSVQYYSPRGLTSWQRPEEKKLYATPDRFLVHKTDQTISEKICKYSQDENKIHIFTFPSRYDAGELTWDSSSTFRPGSSQDDSRSKNKKLFALIDAYLAKGGFNMMAHVLNGENSECMRGGELFLAGEEYTSTPSELSLILPEELNSLNNEKFWDVELANIQRRVEQFSKESWNRLELPCLETVPDKGKNPIHFILTATPHLGAIQPYENLLKIRKVQIEFEALDKKGRTTQALESQKKYTPEIFSEKMKQQANKRWEQSEFLRTHFTSWATLANSMAQFEYALFVAQKNPDKQIVLHLSGTKLELYRNSSRSVATGLIYATHFFDERLRNEKIENLIVAFERPDYPCDETTKNCAQILLTKEGKDGQPLFSQYR